MGGGGKLVLCEVRCANGLKRLVNYQEQCSFLEHQLGIVHANEMLQKVRKNNSLSLGFKLQLAHVRL